MDIATALKEFRQEHGLEQEELAKMLDTTQQTVSNWESGGTMPRANALKRINHVLATYRPGVGPAPYVEPPRIQGDGYPTFASTMIPKEELAVRNATAHGIKVKSEYETRRAVAESLAAIADPGERFALMRSRRQEFEQQMIASLGHGIEFMVNAPVDFQALRLRADYLSPKVCAEIKTINEPKHVNMGVEGGIHQLTTLRAVLKHNNQPREYFVLIMVVSPGAGLRPMALSRLVTLASLHDVHVFITGSAEETAQILTELETCSIDELRDKYIDDLL